MVPSNPAADLSPRLDRGGIERPRSRALGFNELAQLFGKVRETPSFGADNGLAVCDKSRRAPILHHARYPKTHPNPTSASAESSASALALRKAARRA